MRALFERSKLNPILEPNSKNSWENKKLYNPGAVFYNKKYHLFYRAIGSGENWRSSIGYAVSNDGEKFHRFGEPLLVGESEQEKRGMEDPRISKINNLFYMAYAAYDGRDAVLNIATSKDLKTWQKKGPAFANWRVAKAGGVHIRFDSHGKAFAKQTIKKWSKSGAIFPEKINGKYYLLFGEYSIWLAVSNDGLNWKAEQSPFLKARPGNYFDNTFVEMGPPPIKTKKGWLILYHGIDNKQCYRIGFLLLDIKNPHKILFRSKQAIFAPEKDYETNGIIDVLPGGLKKMQKMSKKGLTNFLTKTKKQRPMPKVIFCCGAILSGKTLRIYYGAGDSTICTATADINALLNICH